MDAVVRMFNPKVGKTTKHILKDVHNVQYQSDRMFVAYSGECSAEVEISDNVEISFYGKYMTN